MDQDQGVVVGGFPGQGVEVAVRDVDQGLDPIQARHLSERLVQLRLIAGGWL